MDCKVETKITLKPKEIAKVLNQDTTWFRWHYIEFGGVDEESGATRIYLCSKIGPKETRKCLLTHQAMTDAFNFPDKCKIKYHESWGDYDGVAVVTWEDDE